MSNVIPIKKESFENLGKPKNKDRRPREHLYESEVENLIKAAKSVGRHKSRDATLILITYRHGLRVSEAVNLKWSQINLEQGLIHINRMKNGVESTHPLTGRELRELRKLKRDYPETDYVFISERKTPIVDHTFRKILQRAGEIAALPFSVHPHMLRHSTGFYLANAGHDTRSIQHYMGHRRIENTVIYTNIAAKRFENFWKD